MGVVLKSLIPLIMFAAVVTFYLPESWDTGPSPIDDFITQSNSSVAVNSNLNAIIPAQLSTDSASIGSGSLSFIDSLKMVWGAFQFLATMVGLPIVMFLLIPNFPIPLAALLSLPHIIVLTLGIIAWWKGNPL